jgi:hypothetical protein
MAEEFTPSPADPVGEMHIRRETMADGRRYIIYYTFGDGSADAAAAENEVDADV